MSEKTCLVSKGACLNFIPGLCATCPVARDLVISKLPSIDENEGGPQIRAIHFWRGVRVRVPDSSIDHVYTEYSVTGGTYKETQGIDIWKYLGNSLRPSTT